MPVTLELRMKYFILSVIIIVVFSCAQSTYIAVEPWPQISYTGFKESIDKLAGEGAIDCGFHDLMSREGKRSYKLGVKCVKEAVMRGHSFKFGTVRLPIDSIAHEILVLSPKSEYWLVVNDRMFDDDSPQQWTQKCKEIKFNSYVLFYGGVGCTEVKNGDWF